MNTEQLYKIIRSFGYTTSGQSDEIADAIASAFTPPAPASGEIDYSMCVDAARLDYLDEHAVITAPGQTIRAAIDAAMTKDNK